jgi:hypothetical protein
MLAKQVLLPLEPHIQFGFALVILEMGSLELFAWTGFRPGSSGF